MDSKLSAEEIVQLYIDKNVINKEIKNLADKVLSKILDPTRLYTPSSFAKLKAQLRTSEDNLKLLETERRELEILIDVLNARKLDLANQTAEEMTKKEDIQKKIEEKEKEKEDRRKAEEERIAREAAEKEERHRLRLAQLKKLENEKKARINAPAFDSTPQISAFLTPAVASTSSPSQPASSHDESASESAVASSSSLATARFQSRLSAQRQQRMGQVEEEAILQAAVEHFKKTNNIWSKDLRIPGISRPWTSLRKKAIRLIKNTSVLRLQQLGMSQR